MSITKLQVKCVFYLTHLCGMSVTSLHIVSSRLYFTIVRALNIFLNVEVLAEAETLNRKINRTMYKITKRVIYYMEKFINSSNLRQPLPEETVLHPMSSNTFQHQINALFIRHMKVQCVYKTANIYRNLTHVLPTLYSTSQ